MRITITKHASRTQLTCERADGSRTSANLGPNFPQHDLAHFVVESHLGLEWGFFGQIAAGRSIQDLSDPAIIRSLGPEAWMAEVLTRNLQALSGGACTPEEYPELVAWEFNNLKLEQPPQIAVADVEQMAHQLAALQRQWAEVTENYRLVIFFAPTT